MNNRMPHLFLCAFVLLAIGITGIAQQSATEAPAGFDTPSFTPAQSVSNGIAELTGDTFALDQQHFEQKEDSRLVWARYTTRHHVPIAIRTQ